MIIDPGLIRAEAHTEIGLLIQRDASLLLDRWISRVKQEQPNARRVHHDSLIDHFYDFLQALGRSLAESDDIAACQHCMPASVHGETRWEIGWSLPEVIRDYQILRLVIVDYLQEELDHPLAHQVVAAIGLALDEAIAASVTMFVTTRDAHMRQLEEERAERDRQIQTHLQQREEALREVDRRKNEFLATLGHELRNPLAPLWHAARLFELHDTTDPVLAQVRDILQRQVQQLSRLADDLLDISRIAQGKIELRKAPAELGAIIDRAKEMSDPHLRARHHQLHFAPPAEPIWLEADAARLVQVIANLLNNAAKYTEPGGEIWLKAERHGAEAVLSVRDNGMGIPSEMLPHVFELFTQGEWSLDHAQGGIGIGLALVRKIVDLHHGTISVSSAGLGEGSEFVVRLPVSAELSARPEVVTTTDCARPSFSPNLPHRRILVVDDNVDAADSLGVLLSLEGHEVQTAYDGLAALSRAKDFQPEVILLDIGLPRMNGHEVAQRLRQRPEAKSVLLVALTGYGQDEDRQRSFESGFNAHLIKPVDLAALRSVLIHAESLVSEAT